MTLTEINNNFDISQQKDKGRHGYFEIYDNYFFPLKLSKINLLEIGLWTGASVRIWEKYFTIANIFSIDKDPACLEHKFDRACISVVDQSDESQLKNYSKNKNFDIIIDDGSHYPLHQIISFKVLFEKLNNKGLYIIEDLHVGYQEAFRGCRGWTVAFLSNLLHYLNFRGKIKFLAEYEKENHIFQEYDGQFEFLHFYPGLCIIKKR